MDTSKRKQSPRAPSMSLDEAILRASKIYKEEGRHAAPAEVVLRHIGYAGKSGSANQAIASLRYWGLIDRPSEGKLEITKAFETYEYAPEEAQKRSLLIEFLKKPQVIAELLEKYKERLPSDANIKYDLIQKGFFPDTADACLAVFKRSLEYTKYFEYLTEQRGLEEEKNEVEDKHDESSPPPNVAGARTDIPLSEVIKVTELGGFTRPDTDRIPVRLTGNRRAWIEVPIPFYKADIERLKAQIELLLTDDE